MIHGEYEKLGVGSDGERERGDEREERGLVRWLAMALTVGLVTVGPAMVAG